MKQKKAAKQFRQDFGHVFQRKLMRVLYQTPSFIPVVRPVIDEEFFESVVNQWVVGQLYLSYDSGDRATKAVLLRELKQAVAYGTIDKAEAAEYRTTLTRLTRDVPDANYVKEHVGGFVKHAKIRQGLMKTALAFEQDGDPEEAEKELRKLNRSLISDVTSIDPSAFRRHIRRFLKTGPGKVRTGVPTGLPRLDNAFGGHKGLPGSRLATLAASSGAGKSLGLTYFGATALQYFALSDTDSTVLHFTGEDDRKAMYLRYQASILGLSTKMFKYKKYMHDVERRYLRECKRLGKRWEERLIVHEFDSDELSVEDIESAITNLKSIGRPPGLVIIDYADLLLAREADNSYNYLGNVYQELKESAKRTKLPYWTATQVTRDAQGRKRVDVSDTEGSMKKIHKSDVVVIMQQTKKEKQRGKGRLNIAKVRFGKEPPEINVTIDYEKQRIQEA